LFIEEPGRQIRAMTLHKYLFVDDRWIASAYAVHRRVGCFAKDYANPILVPDQRWEGNGIYCFGTCLEEDRYKLWYQVYVFNDQSVDTRYRTAVGYAESLDGKHWLKPLVGMEHPAHGLTNLVSLSSGRSHLCSPTVVRDDSDPDKQRRYKMLYFDSMRVDELAQLGSPFLKCPDVPGWRGLEGEGLFTLTSPDGIHWQRRAQPIIGSPCDASSLTCLDNGSFLATFKTSIREDRHFRVVAESTSRDFETWSEPCVVLEPDWRDPPGTEFYGMTAFDYCGNRLGFLWVYHNAPDDKHMDVQLVSWTAQAGWQRAADRGTILRTGERGSWDGGSVVTASSPVVGPRVDPDNLWLYYGGGNVRHDDSRYRRNAIGLGYLRRDGFASMVATHFPGTLRTRPLAPAARKLWINADTRHGTIMVTVFDAKSYQPVGQSRTIVGKDETALSFDWESPWQSESDDMIVLEFSLKQAALYSFWFE
jgi:hypothetical protein